ncbi:hypothetical protein MTR67_010000 [Solanum verrucosum]|uniref:Uncharacterized protein n=1 Tax=Solanum verrucosum TaxID=315347 RepID=A0AAF0TKN6_SOLVR|nr:hypothetical protein MTR67_010000 [Solanum verrucosum]
MNDAESEISAPLIHCNDGTAAKDDNSLVEQVALTVPVTDDPTFPVVTFRMWFLGTTTCFLLSFLNQFFFYRRQPLSVSSISAQIVVVPLGHLMARLPFSNAKFPFLVVFVVLFLCPRPTVGFRASWHWSRRHWTRLVYHILLSWKPTS